MEVVNVTEGAEAFTCNAYLVRGERTALVDAGTMSGVADVVREHTNDLDAVALTHQHADHVGELDAVLDAFGGPGSTGSGAGETEPDGVDLYAYGEHPRRTREIEDGDAVRIGDEEFEVVYTPGHASDHVSFIGDTTLFSGDVVVYNDGAFDDGSFGRTDMAGQSRERLIESLRTLLDRLPGSVTRMYAGHGDAFVADDSAGGDSVRDVIERALERAERREPKYPE